MIKSKKSATGVVWLVAMMAAILLFFFLYTNVWAGLFGKTASGTSEQIDLTGDKDQDNLMNRLDKCPCKAGDIENDGCPIGYKPTDNEDKSCLTKTTWEAKKL